MARNGTKPSNLPTSGYEAHKTGPLRLLDLPRDVLELIVNEVTHTNELTSLALTNSALHSLVVPRIYSRFEIVWPEKQSPSETYAGVDALTYGLSTLVTSGGAIRVRPDCCAQKVLGKACSKCSAAKSQAEKDMNPQKQPRPSNHLAQYIRRFSIANGPPGSIDEFYVSSECGKMLGTLTALALARMPRLETFVWDMPTGVLREVWMALSSFGELEDSRLERVWMRCPEGGMINGDGDENLGRTANAMNLSQLHTRRRLKRPRRPSNYLDLSYLHIESPSFSLLPPLKSITVLEMDEPAYLQELSVAVATSVETLRELRIGTLSLFYGIDWAGLDRVEAYTKSPTDARLGFLATGGVLGLIMKGICDCRQGQKPVPSSDPPHPGSLLDQVGALALDTSNLHSITENTDEGSSSAAASSQANEGVSSEGDCWESSVGDKKKKQKKSEQLNHTVQETKKLRLETLELENITIRSMVLRYSIQWEVLTSLTLLNCGSDERLWKLLTGVYGPARNPTASTSTIASPTDRRKTSESDHARWSFQIPKEYRLNLKKIHTNKVSFTLITFLNKCLRPNSLEQLFLQETSPPTSKVTIQEIYHGPVRHHRLSLHKLLIDSVNSRNPRVPPGTDPLGDPGNAMSKGKKWAVSRKILSFIMSGKMPKLRELAVVIDYKDWHFLLQGLSRIPHLRALYLPQIMNHPNGASYEALELANQVLNVNMLRSEMELAYLAIWKRCFEILEDNGEPPAVVGKARDDHPSGANNEVHTDEGSDDGDGDDDDDDEDIHNADEESDENQSATHDDSSTFTTSESSLSSDEWMEMRSQSKKGKVKVKRLKLKLREILFYDDKVSIFKARHGKIVK